VKNFDEARGEREKRDRSFQIGGEEFTYRAAVAPEAILHWSKMTGGEIPDLTEEQALEIFDETVQAFLEPGQSEKWEKVRNPNAKHPLNIGDLRDLVSWLFEEQTARPTTPPSDSSDGSESGGTGTNSTEESPLQVVKA
jgi:hypothetical protein